MTHKFRDCMYSRCQFNSHAACNALRAPKFVLQCVMPRLPWKACHWHKCTVQLSSTSKPLCPGGFPQDPCISAMQCHKAPPKRASRWHSKHGTSLGHCHGRLINVLELYSSQPVLQKLLASPLIVGKAWCNMLPARAVLPCCLGCEGLPWVWGLPCTS